VIGAIGATATGAMPKPLVMPQARGFEQRAWQEASAFRSAADVWIGALCRQPLGRRRFTGCRLFLRQFAQPLFFLLAFLFQISLALFKRVIWFCQNGIPDRHKPNKALH
jgi:hypothetical protein